MGGGGGGGVNVFKAKQSKRVFWGLVGGVYI